MSTRGLAPAVRSHPIREAIMRTSPLLRSAAAIAICVAARATAAPLFTAPYLSFGTAGQPRFVAVGDLNGDGKADLVATSELARSLSVLLSISDGTFAQPTYYLTGAGPLGPVIGDVDGDGVPDIVVPDQGSGTISVFVGHGDGGLGTRTDYTVGSDPTS